MTELTREEAEQFVRAVVEFASMADRVLPQRSSPLTRRLSQHLGGIGEDVSSTSMSAPIVERVNVQLALDTYADTSDRFDVIGLDSDIGKYGVFRWRGWSPVRGTGPARRHASTSQRRSVSMRSSTACVLDSC